MLRVIGERPGVTVRELAAASNVTGGTLYTLLRRLAQEGTLEKRELPSGQTGYALAGAGASDDGRSGAGEHADGSRRSRGGGTDSGAQQDRAADG